MTEFGEAGRIPRTEPLVLRVLMLHNGAGGLNVKRRHHTPDQVIRKIAEGEKLLNAGNDVAEVCRQLEIRLFAFQRGMTVSSSDQFGLPA